MATDDSMGVVGFSLPAAAHMLRTVETARKGFKILRRVKVLLDNGTIPFSDPDLPQDVTGVLALIDKLDEEMASEI